MANKIPLKARFSAGDVVALGEMEPGDTVDPSFLQNGGGYPVYDNTVDYSAGTRREGSDGNLYRAVSANGPSSTVVDPVGDTTGVWVLAFNSVYLPASGTDTYTVNGIPVPPSVPVDGQVFLVDFTNANTGASTLNTVDIKDFNGLDPNLNALNGHIELIYNSSQNRYEFQSIANVPLPRGYIDGLITSVNSIDPDHDIDVTTGDCRDSSNSFNINATVGLTKQIDAAWAEGTDAGGLASALTLTADTTYHFFAIAKTDGTVDFGWDTDLTASNLLADATGYIYYRRVASHMTDPSVNIITYTQTGDHFRLSAPVRDYSVGNPGTANQFIQMTVPAGIQVLADISVAIEDNTATTTTYANISSTDQTAVLPSSSLYTLEINVNSAFAQTRVDILTNVTKAVQYRQSVSTADHVARLFTYGWTDFRGKQ